MWKRILIFCMALVLVVATGCSMIFPSDSQSNAESKKEQTAQKEEKEPDYSDLKVPGALEKVDIRSGPGKYGGEKYDLKKIRPQLDEISPAISANQLESKLIKLLAEDFRPYVKEYGEFDTSVIDIEAGPGSVRNIEVPEGREINMVILLDASGSMAEKVEGGEKMALAKEAVQEFVSNMPKGANVSLQVYGHKGSGSKKDKDLSCKSIEEVYTLGEYDDKQFQAALDDVKAAGWTPLGGAIQQANETLSERKGSQVDNVVYVVSDGIETCGGDPVAAAEELHDSDIQAVVNIIGFDVDNEGQEALVEVADAGGGTYQTVDSKVDLEAYFAGEYKRLFEEWQKWAKVHEEKAQIIAAHKLDALDRYHRNMRELAEWEYYHFKDALTYLKEERDFEYDTISPLESRFYNRRETLKSFSYETKEGLQSKVRANRDQIKDDVRHKRDEEQDRISN